MTHHWNVKDQEDYHRAILRLKELRDRGDTAESSAELAEIEGAIAAYVAVPGQPDQRKGRPDSGGSDVP